MRPPQLEVQPTRLPPMVLPAAPASPDPADPHPAESSSSAALRLANTGGVTLALHVSVEPRSDDLLRPGLWLDPGSNYTAAFTANSSGACCQLGFGAPTTQAGMVAPGKAACGSNSTWGACFGVEGAGALQGNMADAEDPGSGSGPRYLESLEGGVKLRAGAAPLRSAATLMAPAVLRTSLIRRAECDGHFLVLCSRPQAPRHRGALPCLQEQATCLNKALLLTLQSEGLLYLQQ